MQYTIAIIGSGPMGFTSGVAFASWGHKVRFLDLNPAIVEKINAGKAPFYEPGLQELFLSARGNIAATADYSEALKWADIAFICVGTPEKPDGSVDLKYVESAATSLGQNLPNAPGLTIINKSTVPPGTVSGLIRETLERISGGSTGKDFYIGSNPEFLAEGRAVEDALRPDKIVLGVSNDRAKEVLLSLYSHPSLSGSKIVLTDTNTAEAIKYGNNNWLPSKVCFVNEVGRVLLKSGIDVYEVVKKAKELGMEDFLEINFEKEVPVTGSEALALKRLGEKAGIKTPILDSIVESLKPTAPAEMDWPELFKGALYSLHQVFLREYKELGKVLGFNSAEVVHAVSLDRRAAHGFLDAGPGIGGSCFVKDLKGIAAAALGKGYEAKLLLADVESDKIQKSYAFERLKEQIAEVKGKSIAVIGLAFKPDTDDIRESAAIKVVGALIEAGAEVRAWDPQAAENMRKLYPNITYFNHVNAALAGADAAIILTHWKEVREADFSGMKGNLIVDARKAVEKGVAGKTVIGICWP